MLRLKIKDYEKTELLKELINEFYSPLEYALVDDGEDYSFNEDSSKDLNEIKREIYLKLKEIKGEAPEWGILTGVRPVKLAGELLKKSGSREEAENFLKDEYLLSENKRKLILDMYEYQISSLGNPPDNSAALYIGIPFCPTRCLYCSFASNQVGEDEIEDYLKALKKEIKWTSMKMKEEHIKAESLYFGGGTPTTLNHRQLEELLDFVANSFDLEGLKEFTVEAGRPDTIDLEKLKVLKKSGVNRISINPQSMKEETLKLIGRSHSPQEIIRAFDEAKEVGFQSINADIIAGLPEETIEDFNSTLNKMIELGADNITVHSLAVKRASRLNEEDPAYHYRYGKLVTDMVNLARETLINKGYIPYYLYRQKNMAGANDNTGYCIPGKEGMYNVRIMDEHQHVIALGAGAVSKVFFPDENRLERVANVTNYRQYIDRIDEMLERKEKGFFTEE